MSKYIYRLEAFLDNNLIEIECIEKEKINLAPKEKQAKFQLSESDVAQLIKVATKDIKEHIEGKIFEMEIEFTDKELEKNVAFQHYKSIIGKPVTIKYL